MTILSDEEIIKKFNNFRERFLNGWKRENWLKEEVRDNYSALDGFAYDDGRSGQWDNLDFKRRQDDLKPMYQINKLGRVVDSIAGFQVQNRSEVRYMPRDSEVDSETLQGQLSTTSALNPPGNPQMKLADIVNDGIAYIRTESRADLENSMAYVDMLTCGIGVVDNLISYDEKPEGAPDVSRIAPYLAMWDVAARRKNLTDANAVASATLHDRDALLEEINQGREEGDQIAEIPTIEADDHFLQFFRSGSDDNLAASYNFQWRMKEPFWQVQNTLKGRQDLQQLLAANGALQAAKDNFGADITKDDIINVPDDSIAAVKDAFAQVSVGFKATKQRIYKYYRANIVGDIVVSKSENYSQKSFSLKFMTGKWSETRQCWYGVLSASKHPQRLLNKAMSDLSELLYISPHGGVVIEAGAVGGGPAELKAFKETWAKQREVTIVADGAISGAKFKMKDQAQISPAILQTIEYAERSILECAGVNQEFLGVADGSDQQAAMLQAQRVRQGLTVLAPYFDAMSFFVTDQSKLFVDMLRVLAENSGGLIIRNLSGSKAMPYVRLLKDHIATDYDIIAKEVPKTPDERQRETEVLLKIADMLTNAGRDGGAILPLIIENQDIKSDKVEEVLAATAPKAPPPPDPVQQGLIQAQTEALLAEAEKKKADTKSTNLDLLQQFKQIRDEDVTSWQLQNEKLKADIQETITTALLNVAKIIESGQNVKQLSQEMANDGATTI